MAGGLGSRQVVHDHFGRANHLRTSLITTLNHFENGVVGFSRIMALRKRFMPVRVERLADNLLTLDAMLTEQLLQLLQRHLHTLMKLRGVARGASGQSPFEIVNDRQQLDDERFLLRHRAGLAFLPAALLEIIKVSGQRRCKSFCSARSLRSASDSLAAVSTVVASASSSATGGLGDSVFMG
jgi:hypothetical protein